MDLQAAFFTECFIAFIIAIRTLANMFILMFPHPTFRTEYFLTLIKAILTLILKYTLMKLHLTFGTEIFNLPGKRYVRSPICIGRSTFKLRLVLNVLLHTSQRYGRSPVRKR